MAYLNAKQGTTTSAFGDLVQCTQLIARRALTSTSQHRSMLQSSSTAQPLDCTKLIVQHLAAL